MKRRIFTQTIKWFLPLLFITFINGKTFFIHNHLENDSIIVHSHPFKRSENKTHHHTTKELIAIEFHTQSYATDAIVPHIEINSLIFYIIPQDYPNEDILYFAQENNPKLLRAPPYFFHS